MSDPRSPNPSSSDAPAAKKPPRPRRRRKSAGGLVLDWVDRLAVTRTRAPELRRIAADDRASWAKRAAANWMLDGMQTADPADFEPYLRGELSLTELRKAGINTRLVKRVRVRTRPSTKNHVEEIDRQIDFVDRTGPMLDRLLDRTYGKPVPPAGSVAAAGPSTNMVYLRPEVAARI